MYIYICKDISPYARCLHISIYIYIYVHICIYIYLSLSLCLSRLFFISFASACQVMTSSSEEEATEEEEAKPAVKESPFEKEERTRSRSRHRRRRHRSGLHEGEHRTSKASRRHSSRAARRDKDADGKRRETRSKVPEPPSPPKRQVERTRSSVPEPDSPPRKKEVRPDGKNQGGKANQKGSRWKCRICQNKVAPYQAALEQHQYDNEWCIAHQVWDALTEREKSEPGAWTKCREKAYHVKVGRRVEARELGLDQQCSDDDDRAPTPAAERPSSSCRRFQLRSVAKTHVETPPVEKEKSQVDHKSTKEKKKKKKKKSKDSQSSAGSSTPRSGRRKQVVINIR